MGESTTEYVLVTEYFHPDTASTGQLMTDLAVGLHDRGLDMTVYTSQPNYHSGDNERQPRLSEHEGVTVKRIRAPQVRQSSLPRRLFNWFVFTVWMSLALLVDRHQGNRELLYVSNPPFLPSVLWFVCRVRGWDYTYIVHDVYPAQPVELGYLSETGLVTRVWRHLDSCALVGAKHVVALGPVMKQRLVDRTDGVVDPSKVHVIHNWADGEFIKPMNKSDNPFSEQHGLVEPFTILYSGNIAHFHDLETLVSAAREFRGNNVQFLIIGEGDNKDNIVNMTRSFDMEGDTVIFLPFQPEEVLPYSLTAGDISVVSVREGFEGVCVSSKLYTSMAAGQPLLVIAQPDDDEARLVDRFNAGIHVEQGDVAGVVAAINQWRRNPELVRRQGENARQAFEDHFRKDQAIDQYYDILSST